MKIYKGIIWQKITTKVLKKLTENTEYKYKDALKIWLNITKIIIVYEWY